jgi:hypothetical protein
MYIHTYTGVHTQTQAYTFAHTNRIQGASRNYPSWNSVTNPSILNRRLFSLGSQKYVFL